MDVNEFIAQNMGILSQSISPGIYTPPTTTPVSGTAYQNTTPVPMMIFVYSGTVSAISLTPPAGTATATGVTSGMIILPASWSITLTWSVQPSWSWWQL